MKRRFTTIILALVGVLAIVGAAGLSGFPEEASRAPERSAATTLTDGKVYRIVNAGYNHAITANGAGNLKCIPIDEQADAQLWLAVANPAGEGFYMRNLKTGYYMSSSRRRSGAWQADFTITPDDLKVLLKFVNEGGNWVIHTVNGFGLTNEEGNYGFAHEDAQSNVVGWTRDAGNSKWKVELQDDLTSAQIEAKKAGWLSCVSDITPGKAYRIRNYHYGHNMAPGSGNTINGIEANPTDSTQIWIVEANPAGDGLLLRNYANGGLLASSCQRETGWNLREAYVPDQTTCALQFVKKSAGFGIVASSSRQPDNEGGDYTYAHENNVRRVLGYLVNSNPSMWHFTEVADITPADIEAKRLTWDNFKKNSVDVALAAIFADAACTELTPAYAGMNPDALDTDPNVLALPEGLRPMVRKVLTGDWSEIDPYNGNEWDSGHARKFRVMKAEPYSDAGHGATLAGIQAYGDVNNPTGIVTDNGSTLYVMLDKEPKEGSTLRIAGRTGEGTPMATLNNNGDGYLLHKGLNIVPCTQDLADMMLYYTVRTTNNRTRLRVLDDYEDIKVHIEGGSLNGYFNAEGDELYTPDTNEDWLYYRERARHAMFMLTSKYNTLYIHFHDIFDANGGRTQCLKSLCSPEAYAQGRYDLNATMAEWDKLYLAETLIMGLQPDSVIQAEKDAGRDYYDLLEGDDVARNDYHKYFNNRHLGVSLRECGFMNATWWRTAYNPSTISSIIREFPTGDLWGPAHEFGHLNQGPMNMAGCSEESNNVFSNVALFYRGTHSSRADFPSVQRRLFNEGRNFHEHGTWGTTRMWFQLWLYYHCIGHNKKFYPRLYELLRNNPLRRTNAPGYEGVNPFFAKDDQLHFAKMCCIAAEEDLTDFFDAWGFLVPQDGYFIGDYTSYTAYLSKEEIEDFRQEIATMAEENGWPKNTSVIFIDDRVGSTKQSYGFDNTKCGTMGGLKDFSEGAPVSGEYTFTISGTTVTATGGTGGVGFLIRDENGHLLGFGNETSFEVSPAAAEKIRSGEVTFCVVTPESEEIEVVDAVHGGSLEQRLQAIDELLEKSALTLAMSDPRGLNPGFLKPELVAGLQAVFDDVKAKRQAGEITLANNVDLYNTLYDEFMAVRNIVPTAENTIPVRPGAMYVFTSNILHTGKGITANAAGTQLAPVNPGDVDMENEAQQWIFEPADEDGYFYIRNVKTGKYIGKAAADRGAVALVDEPMKQLVVFRELGGFSISPLGSDHDSLHDDGYGRLTRWDSSSKASRWTLSMCDNWEYRVAWTDLDAIIRKAEQLLVLAGTITETGEGAVAEPSADYQFVTPEMMLCVHELIKSGKLLLEQQPAAEAQELTAACENLTVAYNELFSAVNRNVDRLIELVEKTRALADSIGHPVEEIADLPLTEEHLYSNAPHMEAGGDKFTSWNVLLDKNLNTFFHSTYSNTDTPDGLDHYIRVELPEAVTEESELIFEYNTRNSSESAWYPALATLEYSADGETWHNAAELDAELPFGPAHKFESDPFTVPAGTRFLRFMVHKNRFSPSNPKTQTAGGGHHFFVISELGVKSYAVACGINLDEYPDGDEDAVKNAVTLARKAANALARNRYSNTEYDDAYEALKPAYDRLAAIYATRIDVGIGHINADDDSLRHAVIMTLDGLRVSRITTSGIYIINGHKTFVRK